MEIVHTPGGEPAVRSSCSASAIVCSKRYPPYHNWSSWNRVGSNLLQLYLS